MQNISLTKLFLIYLKIGTILLGGGYVILPLMLNEFCEKRNLITQEEMTNYFALSQVLPGIIAANMSMFIGYKLKGKLGAAVAVIGIIFTPFISIVALASILKTLANNDFIQSALSAVGIAVIVLITLTVKEVLHTSKKDSFFCFLLFLSLILTLCLRLSPIQVILISTLIGVFYTKLRKDSL